MMRRKGFLINSTAIILIIPLLLLVATYEDVSSFIVQSQSQRAQVERTYDVVTFLNLEFQKAMELSGKRAVVSAVDYVAVTGRFIPPSYKANNTIADLIRRGNSPSITGYDTERVMAKQTLKVWLSNVTKIMRKQGYVITPSVDDLASETEITVAPLDAFTIVIKARIPHVNIKDSSGVVVYDGPIPSTGGYVYSTVDLRELEDPFHSAMTGGRYHRSLRACKYAFPELTPPFTVANGTGNGSGVVVGKFGTDLQYNSTHIWDSNNDYITNLTISGVRVTTDAVILNDGDIGVMVFGNGSSGSGGLRWCYPSLHYRVNFTLNGGDLSNYDGYQIPIVITDSSILDKVYNVNNNASIRIVEKGTCTEVPFWIEYWSSTKAIIWIKATTSMGYTMYFGSDPSYATRGNGTSVFEWFHGTEEVIPDDAYKYFNLSSLGLSGDIAIDFRAKPSKLSIGQQWDSGIVVETTDSNNNSQWIYFIDDTVDTTDSLEVWDEYYVWNWFWGWVLTSGPSTHDGARGDTNFHTYESVIEPNTNGAYVDFLDYGTDYSSYPNPVRENPDNLLGQPYTRHYTAPLKYLYLVNLDNGNKNDAIFEWIFIRKYIQNLPTETFSAVEQEPTQTATSSTKASVYDLQPLIDCLLDNRYFAIPDGWSFFERLEGSNQSHSAYVTLAQKMQNEMNYKPPSGYYPIGLVSFMIPDPNYDSKLFSLMGTLGFSIKNISSADYYFLPGYFKRISVPDGYRVWGISYGSSSSLGNLANIPFFLDPDTAKEILGTQGTCQLLYGYSCG